MPTKRLTSPLDRNGFQKIFQFGGGSDVVFTANEDASGVAYIVGYWIEAGGGDDVIYGSDIIHDPFFDTRADVLVGGDGSDTIYGGGGNDSINGGNIGGADSSKGQKPPPTNLLVGDGVRQSDGSYPTFPS